MNWNQVWRHRGPVARLLWPLSRCFALLVRVRRLAYHYHLLRRERLPVPVIVVGNLTVGGTGKSPVVQAVVAHLKSRGYRPGIVARGYGVKIGPTPLHVAEHPYAERVGDEPLMHWQHCHVPVYVHPDRAAAARALLQAHPVDVVVSDDGLQHYRLARDLEILVTGAQDNLGNGWMLPAGPLREPISRSAEVDYVVTPDKVSRRLGRVTNLWSRVTRDLDEFNDVVVDAVAGIGNPQQFFNQLSQAGLRLRTHAFADHWAFSEADLRTLAGPIMMTEKDAVKCVDFADKRLWYVELDTTLAQDLRDLLDRRLPQLHQPLETS